MKGLAKIYRTFGIPYTVVFIPTICRVSEYLYQPVTDVEAGDGNHILLYRVTVNMQKPNGIETCNLQIVLNTTTTIAPSHNMMRIVSGCKCNDKRLMSGVPQVMKLRSCNG